MFNRVAANSFRFVFRPAFQSAVDHVFAAIWKARFRAAFLNPDRSDKLIFKRRDHYARLLDMVSRRTWRTRAQEYQREQAEGLEKAGHFALMIR